MSRDVKVLMSTCLLLCIERGNVELMGIFLDNGADPNGTDPEVSIFLLFLLS